VAFGLATPLATPVLSSTCSSKQWRRRRRPVKYRDKFNVTWANAMKKNWSLVIFVLGSWISRWLFWT